MRLVLSWLFGVTETEVVRYLKINGAPRVVGWFNEAVPATPAVTYSDYLDDHIDESFF
jgi:hypothetical protein